MSTPKPPPTKTTMIAQYLASKTFVIERFLMNMQFFIDFVKTWEPNGYTQDCYSEDTNYLVNFQ